MLMGLLRVPYQDAFLTPGISPRWAMFRKQMRQMVNLPMYARGRPQRLQRFRCRVLYFGVRFD
jgi:hypothetical protein